MKNSSIILFFFFLPQNVRSEVVEQFNRQGTEKYSQYLKRVSAIETNDAEKSLGLIRNSEQWAKIIRDEKNLKLRIKRRKL